MYDAFSRVKPSKICCGVPGSSPLQVTSQFLYMSLRQMRSAEIDDLALGLDVGTTALKAAVFDGEGNAVSHGRAPTPWQRDELDPDALLRAARDAIEQALDGRRV